jgi:hypothetical protein
MPRCACLDLPSCHTIRLSRLCTLSCYLLALHTLLYLLLFVTTMSLSVIWRHIFHVSLLSVKLQTYGIMKSRSITCAEMWKFSDIVNIFKFDIHKNISQRTRFSFTATCTIANYSLSQLANNWRLQRVVQVQVVLPHQARSSTTRFAHINPLSALTMSRDAWSTARKRTTKNASH